MFISCLCIFVDAVFVRQCGEGTEEVRPGDRHLEGQGRGVAERTRQLPEGVQELLHRTVQVNYPSNNYCIVNYSCVLLDFHQCTKIVAVQK